MARGYVGIKNLERITRKLRDVIEVLKMNTANFDGCGRGGTTTLKEGEVTQFIREKTRLWRRSWSVDPLKEIKKELEKFI